MGDIALSQLAVFAVCAAVAVVSAILMICRRNPVHSALFLVTNFLAVAVLYLSLSAQFIALVQVAVYAGAIMVLFLFVIMLLNLAPETQRVVKSRRELILGGGVAILLFGAFVTTGIVGQLADEAQAQRPVRGVPRVLEVTSPEFRGTVSDVASALFTRHVFAFELLTLLLLSAMVGVLVLGKRRRETGAK